MAETPSGIWLPDDELAAEQTLDAPDLPEINLWRARLHQVDPRLMLIFSKRDAKDLTPGRWHVVRRNEHGRNAYWEINDGAGGYSAFTERHFERLQAMDAAAHPTIWKQWRKAQADKERSKKKRLADKSEEFQEKLLERLGHEFDTRIPVTGADKDKIGG